MRIRSFGFTLIELLVVVGIVAFLAALLFPVFSAAKAKAQEAVCVSDFHQAQLAMALYIGDYDDTYAPVNHRPGQISDSSTDRTWVQLLLPYAKSFSLFRCPADSGSGGLTDAAFDKDLTPGDLASRFYSASLKSNIGYNFLYLSPVYAEGMSWTVTTRSASQISQPSRMLLFVDSVGSVNSAGRPVGGGNWLVVPPCRYVEVQGYIADTFGLMGKPVFAPSQGWVPSKTPTAESYGYAWPWHQGRATVVSANGTTRSVAPAELAKGCDVEAEWAGILSVDSDYQWDLD